MHGSMQKKKKLMLADARLSEYGTSINKEQGHPFMTSNLKCLGDQTQSLCKLLQVNNQYLLGRLQWPQYHREP